MNTKILMTLISLLVLLLTSCAGESNDVVICSSLPLNGGNNERAQSMSRAIQMAIDEQNEKGGVTMGGQTLRYEAMDDTPSNSDSWTTAQEEANARAAIAQHDCIAYIGTLNSGAAKIAIPILNRVQMAMISPANTYPGLTKPDSGFGDEPWNYSPLGPEKRNFCRLVPTDDLQAPAAARYAAETLEAQRLFVFHDTELYGKGLAERFVSTAQGLGLEVLAEPLGAGKTMVASQVATTILQMDPDLVYFGGITENGAPQVLKELRSGGYEGYFMGADGIAEKDFITQAEISADDERVFATLVGQPLAELPERGQEWLRLYRERYDDEPDPFAAPSYEAALVVIQAIQQAQVPQGDKPFLERARPAVLMAMKKTTDFEGILGSWSFDENCDTTDTTITINKPVGGSFAFQALLE